MNIARGIALSDKNWFQTGGKAAYFCEPSTDQDFADALTFAQDNSLEVTMLGEGANILISDTGIQGLVVRPALKNILVEGKCVTAGAGVRMQDLIDECLDNQLVGLEEFSGIPGLLGGCVYINIHYFEFLLSDFLVSAQVIHRDTGVVETVDNEWFHFGYDASRLQARDYFLVSAKLKLKKVSERQAWYAKGCRDQIIRHRNRRYPTERTCGSFFRNFLPEEIEHLGKAKQIPYVAYYLDKLGVKGALRVGNAQVSRHHANMIVTSPGATSNDVVALVRRMQHMVYDEFGLLPQPECQLLGFDKYPFLRNDNSISSVCSNMIQKTS